MRKKKSSMGLYVALAAGAAVVMYFAFRGSEEFDPVVTDFLTDNYGNGTISIEHGNGNIYYTTPTGTVTITPAEAEMIKNGIAPNPEVTSR